MSRSSYKREYSDIGLQIVTQIMVIVDWLSKWPFDDKYSVQNWYPKGKE